MFASQPGVEALQAGMELARQLHVAVRQKLLVEDRLHLEHVAHVVGAREAEIAVDLERQIGEGHRLAEMLRHPRRHLVAGEDLAADAEALSGDARPPLEDAVGAGADVRRRDAGQLRPPPSAKARPSLPSSPRRGPMPKWMKLSQ